jgi:dTDP-4-dehydrorhamnose reductase
LTAKQKAHVAPRVVVLGASGLLGTSLVPYLRGRGLTVIRHGRSGDADVLADLSSQSSAAEALESAKPDVVVNLAGMTNVDECERRPQQAYLANVRVLENVARWIGERGKRTHLVHISTDQLYDGKGPHREESVTLANYYAFSKYAGELAAANVPSTIARTNFFGPSERSGRSSLSDWLVKSFRDRTSVTVFNDVLFSPLSIATLSRVIADIIDKRPIGIFNVGSRAGMSKADFAFALADAVGLPTDTMRRGRSSDVKLTAYRPKDMRMDPSRFEAAMGTPMPELQDEIRSMKHFYRQ